ncbi:hypothetical protein [Sinomicrobium sp. M5D2P9]
MKKTTRAFLLLMCIFTALSPMGYAQHFSLKPLRDIHPVNKEHFSFPFITDSTDAAIRINTWLHGTILETLPGQFQHSPFEKIWPKKRSAQGVTTLNYLVYANNNRYISIDITGEYSGTHSSRFSIIQNFDAQSGQPITLNDLFTSKGLKDLQQLAIKQRADLLNSFLTSLDTTNRDDARQYQKYADCLSSVKKDDLVYDKLLLTNNSLKVIRNSCYSHSGDVYDLFGDFENEFDTEQLKPFLNAYGKHLFSSASSINDRYFQNKKSDIRIGLYRGIIEQQQPVSIFVEKIYGDGSVRAFCYYDKTAKRIDLQTERKPDGFYEFREIGSDQKTITGIFRLKYGHSFHLAGDWRSPDGPSAYQVDLH